MKPFSDLVVVITGASSGIGRATTMLFAGRQAKLVLAARSRENLEQVAKDCQGKATRVLVVPTDVSQPIEVQKLAEQAVEAFGHIDVWINDAGIGLYSRFEESPTDEFRQVIETNLFGAIYGAREAMKQFRRQGSGLLVNISSQLAFGGAPYSSAYVISKYGMRALSDTLREELFQTGIHVCTVYPASTDTPFFQHAANYMGKEVKPLGSISDPREVAKAILRLVEHPKPDTLVGKSGYLVEPLHWFAPRLHSGLLRKTTERGQFRNKPARPRQGNIFEPSPLAAEKGSWRGPSLLGILARVVGLTGGIFAALVLAKRHSSHHYS
jgi:short-subunit dehydrogenase